MENLESTSNLELSKSPWKQRLTAIGIGLGVLMLLGGLIGAVIYLLQPGTPTGKVRDIFIIFMALETLLIGLTLVILIVQIARLINLLQNEVRPILESTQDAANTLRGTTAFLSNNMIEPIVKMNGYLAGLQQLFKFIKK